MHQEPIYQIEPSQQTITTYQMIDPFVSADIALLQHVPQFSHEDFSDFKQLSKTPKAPKLRPQATSLKMPLAKRIELPSSLMGKIQQRKSSSSEALKQKENSQQVLSNLNQPFHSNFWQVENLNSYLKSSSTQASHNEDPNSISSGEFEVNASLEGAFKDLPQEVLNTFIESSIQEKLFFQNSKSSLYSLIKNA